MNVFDFVAAAAALLLVIGAVIIIIRRRKKGACASCDCEDCPRRAAPRSGKRGDVRSKREK